MTPKQFFTRLKAFLKAVAWEDSPNGKIFGDSVYVVPKIPIEQITAYRPPVAFIVDKGAVLDSNHPLLLVQNFHIAVYQENFRDHMTEGTLLGRNRTEGTSKGAGLLDIEEELIPKLAETTVLTTKIMIVEKNIPVTNVAKGNNPGTFRSNAFSVLLSLY